jgi:thioesterase domain-containing protein/acyl carrier protein
MSSSFLSRRMARSIVKLCSLRRTRDLLVAQEFVAPHTETDKKLAAIWMQLLNLDRIGIHDNFFQLGGDSLLAVETMTRIQEDFGVALGMQTLFPVASIASLAKALTDWDESTDGLAYVLPVQPNGLKPYFFFMGTANQASLLSGELGMNQPFFTLGIQPKAAGDPEAPYRMEELGRHLVSALCEKQPEGPLYLGGFCLGAVFAYEVARQLTMQGRVVGLLALFEPTYPTQRVVVQTATAARRMIVRVGFRLNEFCQLGIRGYPLFLRGRWQNVKWMVMNVLSEVSERLRVVKRPLRSLDVERTLFLAAKYYKPKPIKCPTVIVRCKDWPILAAGDPYFGWRQLLNGPTETYQVAGDHMGMFHQPNVHVLAEQLRTSLEKARK